MFHEIQTAISEKFKMSWPIRGSCGHTGFLTCPKFVEEQQHILPQIFLQCFVKFYTANVERKFKMSIRGCGGYVVFPFGLKGNNSYTIVCLLEMNFFLFILLHEAFKNYCEFTTVKTLL